MPFVSRSMMEEHTRRQEILDHFRHHLHRDDNLHVQAISNPEIAAHIAALKLVMNTHLREKLDLVNIEKDRKAEYLKTILDQLGRDKLHEIIERHAEFSHARAAVHHAVLGRSL